MADTPTGETANPGDSKTTEQTQAPVQGNASDNAEVERLKKEAEQSRMRAQQLQNQIDDAKKAEEARKAKELEEQNEFKSLYEQEKAKREEYETQQQRDARQKEIDEETQKVLGEFSQGVKEVAKEAGLALSDTSEEAKAALKEKLDRISSKVSKDAKVSPNNPNSSNSTLTQEQLLERVRYGDKQAKSTAIGNLEAVKAMRQMAGYQDPQ